MLAVDCGNFLEEDATYEKPKKNTWFFSFFACPRLRARFENHRKIAPNGLLERVTSPRALER